MRPLFRPLCCRVRVCEGLAASQLLKLLTYQSPNAQTINLATIKHSNNQLVNPPNNQKIKPPTHQTSKPASTQAVKKPNDERQSRGVESPAPALQRSAHKVCLFNPLPAAGERNFLVAVDLEISYLPGPISPPVLEISYLPSRPQFLSTHSVL